MVISGIRVERFMLPYIKGWLSLVEVTFSKSICTFLAFYLFDEVEAIFCKGFYEVLGSCAQCFSTCDA